MIGSVERPGVQHATRKYLDRLSTHAIYVACHACLHFDFFKIQEDAP